MLHLIRSITARRARGRLGLNPVASMSGVSPMSGGSKQATQARRSFTNYLVSPQEFMQEFKGSNHNSSRIVPVCAAWFLPNDPEKRSGLQVYKQAHIPTARFFDIDVVKDPDSPYPHMLPSAADFGKHVGNMGIKQDDTVIVYDTQELGIFSAPRVAWTFKVFGHEKVHVLNNFRLYVQQGLPTVSGTPEDEVKGEVTQYTPAIRRPLSVVDYEYMKKLAKGAITNPIALDARPAGRFKGTDAEPRPGLSSGHMPGSVSMPFPDLLDKDTKAFLPVEQLRKVFEERNIKGDRPVVSACGTGVTAAIIDTAAAEVGVPENKRMLYDGSWTEWAMRVKPDERLIEKSDDP